MTYLGNDNEGNISNVTLLKNFDACMQNVAIVRSVSVSGKKRWIVICKTDIEALCTLGLMTRSVTLKGENKIKKNVHAELHNGSAYTTWIEQK